MSEIKEHLLLMNNTDWNTVKTTLEQFYTLVGLRLLKCTSYADFVGKMHVQTELQISEFVNLKVGSLLSVQDSWT